MQLALTALWRSYGVEPDAVIGHSMGEVSAAVVAGALTPAEGLRVIATRSRLMSRLAGQGAMALLELDAEAAEALIADYPEVTVAVYASPRQTVIAGPPDQVEAVIAVVTAENRLARRIEVDVASHHRIVDPILPELRAALAGLAPQAGRRSRCSATVDGADGGATAVDAEYWVANLRNPVRFSQAVAAAGAAHTTFIEISPHPLLTHAISDTLGDTHHHALGTLQRDTHDTRQFPHHPQHHPHHPPPRHRHPPGPHPALPTTPWHHSRHWLTTAVTAPAGVDHRGVDGGCVQAAGAVPARPLPEMVLVCGTGGMCRGGYRVQERRLMAGRVADGWCSPMPSWVPSWAGASTARVRVHPPGILDGDLDAQWVAELGGVQRVLLRARRHRRRDRCRRRPTGCSTR